MNGQGHKNIVVGIVVLSLCLIIPLVVLGACSKEGKSKTGTQINTTSVVVTDTSKITSVTTSVNNKTETSDIELNKIVAQGKLNYTGESQESTGKVAELSSYLCDNQVVYLVEIETSMGTSTELVKYFCTYETYKSLSLGTSIKVTYKQTSDNTYAVLSVNLV